ncbi:aspartic peptidase domain-containing protein [Rhodocollybia butyracea]|uniref:Aspartic peptidase domain-containing protein n=1 Tax=Rhodocollybia butyracea TaxID=206335 RepID=A0A9P5UCP7_9AGAR|nr:aspartic peptidase domain-containing protein [Rhodocollybia butyracea]
MRKKSLMQSLRTRRAVQTGSNFTTTVGRSTAIDFDDNYLVNVTIGGQEFLLIADTGSSDTWVPQLGFTCFNASNNQPIPQSASSCDFGTGGFNTSASPTFQVDPDVNFNNTFKSGSSVTGTAGFDTVTVANMSVVNQEIGIVTRAAWQGDSLNTGIMGLASPNLTKVYKGTNPSDDQFPQTRIPYNPFFYSAVQQGLVSNPYFSIALNRGSFENRE